MSREFIRTNVFVEDWANAGLDDDDLRVLENILLENPKAGDVIPRLSGARKIRFAASSHGKSGGVRVVYVDVAISERIYLLLAYPKNVRTNLTQKQWQSLNKMVVTLKGDT